MELIELHYEGKPFYVNVGYITGIYPKECGGCEIYTLGDDQPWNSDESSTYIINRIAKIIN